MLQVKSHLQRFLGDVHEYVYLKKIFFQKGQVRIQDRIRIRDADWTGSGSGCRSRMDREQGCGSGTGSGSRVRIREGRIRVQIWDWIWIRGADPSGIRIRVADWIQIRIRKVESYKMVRWACFITKKKFMCFQSIFLANQYVK
jgi:hypothetical protein